MLKTHKVVEQVEKEEIDDVLCNYCGGSLKHSFNYDGLVEAEICGGYGSKIGDCTQVSFSICEDCLLRMFDEFKIKPKTIEVGPFAGDDYIKEENINLEHENEE